MSRQNTDIDAPYSSLPFLLSSMGMLQAEICRCTEVHAVPVLFCDFESVLPQNKKGLSPTPTLYSDLHSHWSKTRVMPLKHMDFI